MVVLRLLTAGTIEEHIYAVSDEKRKFADSSITGGETPGVGVRRPEEVWMERSVAGAVKGGEGGRQFCHGRGCEWTEFGKMGCKTASQPLQHI